MNVIALVTATITRPLETRFQGFPSVVGLVLRKAGIDLKTSQDIPHTTTSALKMKDLFNFGRRAGLTVGQAIDTSANITGPATER
ncbi:hypothetical protein M407DRAFT_25603 [Tulasnella calospora MUT 4182]|uniref:Uncharacterized protein n=1 Tax=Tulasnella calospora MUT 4182 TaxID=1051891 RepID=A0A0C3LUJ0_9AGAM|nr:hypothetical protein M407DRAFT_25603 [Tulasnella calospora MUT 4182]